MEKKDIEKIVVNFYQSLYTKDTTDENMQNILLSKISTPLQKEDNYKCEGILTEDECYNALKGMKSNKTPGNDGLSKEFYATFWKDIGMQLVEMLNYVKVNGENVGNAKNGNNSLTV